MKYVCYTTPTSYIYCVKDDFRTVRANRLGDANVPSLPVTAHAGNEQVATSLCVYGTANRGYFYAVKGFQALLSSQVPFYSHHLAAGPLGASSFPLHPCHLNSDSHREERGTVALDVTPVSKFDCLFVTLCTIRYVVSLISTLHGVSVRGYCSPGHELNYRVEFPRQMLLL